MNYLANKMKYLKFVCTNSNQKPQFAEHIKEEKVLRFTSKKNITDDLHNTFSCTYTTKALVTFSFIDLSGCVRGRYCCCCKGIR